MKLNPDGEWIHVLDNNFFANPEWRKSIKHLIQEKLPVKFDGVDIRILTREQSIELNKVKLVKHIHIAWDNPNEDVPKEIQRVLDYGNLKAYKFCCYVLIGYDTTEEQDLYRIETLRSMNIDPFIMPYDKFDDYQLSLARYVNRKEIYKACTWSEYKSNTHSGSTDEHS